MNGRLEKELKAEEKMKDMLKNLPPIFSDFYYSMRAAKKSYSTMNLYINYVRNFAEFVTGNSINNDFYKDVDTSTIERYMISLETYKNGNNIERMSETAQATRYSAINTFFNFLVDKKELLSKNPMSKIVRPKVNADKAITYLNKTEINKIKKTISSNEDKNALRDKTIFLTALATGLRVSALMNINIEDIDFDNNIIHVIEKRNKQRDIEIGDNLRQVLYQYIEWRNLTYPNIGTNALFISQKKLRMSTDAANEMIAKYTSNLGKHITMHKLRSTFITNLAIADVPIEVLQRLAGHSNISTTTRYRAVLAEEKHNAINIADKWI